MPQNLRTFIKRKIINPLKRQYDNPTYLARSFAIGMGLAFAPFPGQLPVVTLLWLFLKRSKWRFSLAISAAWTFISNVFTNIPLFYLYYKTGDFIRNENSGISYNQIQEIFNNGTFNGIKYMTTELGLSILAGSLLYMSTFFILGYLMGYSISFFNHKQAV